MRDRAIRCRRLRRREATSPARAMLYCLVLPTVLRGATVDLELRPASQAVFEGDTVDLGLYAVSSDGTNQDVGLIGVVLAWDPAALSLVGRIDNGPFAWASSGFPSEGAGLNTDLTDGDAYYQAVIAFGGMRATADAAGLLVTTLRFTAVSAAAGTTSVSIAACGGTTCSRVLDRHPFEAGVQDITGTLGPPADVTIQCLASAECDDQNPCTDDTCNASSLCVSTPNDANDPDDGLYCNGFESACENGEVIIAPGSIPDCDDGIACTDDSCDEDTDQCVHAVVGGSCLIAGTCHVTGEVNPANECEHCSPADDPNAWSPKPSGAACGNQGEDPCDHADTCDGAGACQTHVEPAGTTCGSGANTTCTDPDTCDGSGSCLSNHAPEGTPCNDGQFCTATDTCQSGACVGVGSNCPSGLTCNESLDECKAINIEWRNVQPQPVQVGQSVEIDLYVVSATAVNQQLSSVAVIMGWNPARLKLLGRVDNGPYSWLISNFPNDASLDGLNNTFEDGDALYQALGQASPNPIATATPAGLHVTTMRFQALQTGQAFVNFRAHAGVQTDTEVLDINPPGLDITGTLGASAVVNVVDCFNPADCDDGEFCTGIEDCVDNQCVPGTPPDCSDGTFCNGEEICQAGVGCISPGNPCPSPGTCDEPPGNCGGCLSPVVVAAGGRYLAVTHPGAAYPVACRTTGDPSDGAVSCLDLYVQADGSLGPLPVFRMPGDWGTVHLTGFAVQPARTYRVFTDCSMFDPGLLSAPVSATTWLWGDVNHDNQVRLSDVTFVIDASQGTFGGGTTVQSTDLAPCWPDGVIDSADVNAAQSALDEDPFPCPAPCAAPGPSDHCDYATSISEGTIGFDTTGATTDGPTAPVSCRVGDSQIQSDVWFCYTPTCTGTATASLCGGGFDSKLAVYPGCGCPVSGNGLGCSDNACGTSAALTFPVDACTSYLIRVGGYQAATGTAALAVTCQPGPPAVDCNGNGLPDACDIADGTSPDIDADGVPDECAPGIPATSQWGLFVLAQVIVVGGTVVLRGRRVG
jgi:hypothetical protein